ncbi:MAG: tetratricopeptide repeat protein [Acetobacteraceae bacterium]|jgi:TPR repeat protein
MLPAAILRARLRAAAGRPQAQLRLADQLARNGASIEAVRHIAHAAQYGLPEAQARLGLCYLRGLGVPANQAEARHWLERAADAGEVTAQTELASLALQGISGPYQRSAFPAPDDRTEPDYQLAAALARRAANNGSADGKALLAFILGLAPAIPQQPCEAETLYRDAAQGGAPLGQLGHAMTLLRQATPEATSEAHDLLTAAADAGVATAQFMLGAMAEAGIGAAPNLEAAAKHYRSSAERGHTVAKTRLGLALLIGRGVPRNLVEAETWLRRAAQDDDVVASAVLGDFHASPERQPANTGESLHWYRHAAELGHPASAHILARAIWAGAEGTPDPREIAAWLEAAIERGDTTAWPDLGGLIGSLSLPPDQLPALHGWLQRMIREDRPEAGFYVGVCVNCGIGTPADERLARRYYLWAAGEGVIEAMVAAAEMLLNGRGGRADPDVARSLFQYAAGHDHAGATYALGVMAGNDPDRAMVHFRRAAALGHAKAKLLVGGEPVTG